MVLRGREVRSAAHRGDDVTAIEEADVVESTAVEVSHVPAIIPAVPAVLAVTPTVQAAELVARLDVIRQAASEAMKENVDFGVIPGTDKPTLLKPGAEKLGVLFQLDVQLACTKTWGPGDHLTVEARATVFHAPTGARVGYGEGLCSTREKKYGKRQQQRTCPTCGKDAIIKGKVEYGGGWLCFKKRGGCGAKFIDGYAPVESQQVGEIDNPELPDLWNTVVKMAEKRARVDGVLAVTGASALFTQDIEDSAPHADEPTAPAGPPYGPAMNPEFATLASMAATKLCGADDAAKKLWANLKKNCGGYMPQSVADAVVMCAEATQATPLDPGAPKVT